MRIPLSVYEHYPYYVYGHYPYCMYEHYHNYVYEHLLYCVYGSCIVYNTNFARTAIYLAHSVQCQLPKDL